MSPAALLPKLKASLTSQSALMRTTVVTAMKFTISDQPQPIDQLLRAEIGHFLTTLRCSPHRPCLFSMPIVIFPYPSFLTPPCLNGNLEIGACRDPDLNVRRVALVAFNSAAHNKPSLIRDLLRDVLPQVLEYAHEPGVTSLRRKNWEHLYDDNPIFSYTTRLRRGRN